MTDEDRMMSDLKRDALDKLNLKYRALTDDGLLLSYKELEAVKTIIDDGSHLWRMRDYHFGILIVAVEHNETRCTLALTADEAANISLFATFWARWYQQHPIVYNRSVKRD